MKRYSRLALSLFAALSIGTPLLAQEAAEVPQITFSATELVPGLYMLEAHGGFGGGNVGLLTGDDGVVLVDDSFPPFSATLLEAVAETAGAPVDFVVNTHVHGDHVGGNELLGKAGATIVAHDNVRGRLLEEGSDEGDDSAPTPKEALPVLTFADAVTFHLNGQEAYVFHVAKAHTDGDAVIHFREADVIHAGDIFFHTIFPFIDIDSGGSLDGYIAAQEKIFEVAGDATQIIPGHGPLASPSDLEASIAMLKAARSSIGAMIDDGKSLEEIVAAKPLVDYEAQNWQFITTERMINQVYRSIKGD